MKNILYLFIIVLCFSCKKDSSTVYNNQLEKSRQAWVAYKASINNSYSYIVYAGSVFGGYTETKITVQSGKVVGRAYFIGIYTQGTPRELQVRDSWIEDSTNLNSHQTGADAITLDDIYAQAPGKWLNADTKKNELVFTTDAAGLITSCGYIPSECQDDCFYGVHIKSITKL